MKIKAEINKQKYKLWLILHQIYCGEYKQTLRTKNNIYIESTVASLFYNEHKTLFWLSLIKIQNHK